jgi:hypothetical protein
VVKRKQKLMVVEEAVAAAAETLVAAAETLVAAAETLVAAAETLVVGQRHLLEQHPLEVHQCQLQHHLLALLN